MTNLNEVNINKLNQRSWGQGGFKMVTGTADQTDIKGMYYAVQFITDSTTTQFSIDNSTTQNATFKAGTVVYGNITRIKCSAGNVYILYKI